MNKCAFFFNFSKRKGELGLVGGLGCRGGAWLSTWRQQKKGCSLVKSGGTGLDVRVEKRERERTEASVVCVEMPTVVVLFVLRFLIMIFDNHVGGSILRLFLW